MCLGDSLTAGNPGFRGYPSYSGNPESQYEFWLEKMINSDFPDNDVEIINFGKGGELVWQTYLRYKHAILKTFSEHDLVILWIGTNDLVANGASIEDVVANSEDLYKLILQAGKKLIVVEISPTNATPSCNEKIIRTNKILKSLCEKYEIPFVNVYDDLLNKDDKVEMDPSYSFGDLDHFNVQGYKKIAELIYTRILKTFIDNL